MLIEPGGQYEAIPHGCVEFSGQKNSDVDGNGVSLRPKQK
ncbi:23704_t:CDS:2 [Entrophospora sp. SA101]|nr:23704_t:CDS:2 [Entrophospora sp. SA101]